MILYHGTNKDFTDIDITKSNPYKDFGKGFYLTDIKEQAQHDYDIVIGPIADDGVAFLLGRYEEGTITLSELARQLEFKRFNRQFFFGSEKAIQLLKRINDE